MQADQKSATPPPVFQIQKGDVTGIGVHRIWMYKSRRSIPAYLLALERKAFDSSPSTQSETESSFYRLDGYVYIANWPEQKPLEEII